MDNGNAVGWKIDYKCILLLHRLDSFDNAHREYNLQNTHALQYSHNWQLWYIFHPTIVRYFTALFILGGGGWGSCFHILRTTLAKFLHCFSENFISNSKTVTLYKYLYASLVSNENELYLKHLIAWKNWVKFGFNELRKLLSNSKKLHLFTNQCVPEQWQVWV